MKDIKKLTKTHDEIASALVTAKPKQKDQVKQNTLADLKEVIKDISALRAQKVVANENEVEASKEQELEKDNFAKAFVNASNDAERFELVTKAAKTYGGNAVETALSNSYEKTMRRRVTAKDSDYEEVTNLRKCNDLVHVATCALGGIESLGNDKINVNMGVVKQVINAFEKQDIEGIREYREALVKANVTQFDSLTAGEGANWVPTIMSSDYIDEMYLELSLAPLFSRVTMDSPTYDIPRIFNRGKAYLMSEMTGADVSTFMTPATGLTADGFQTTKISLTAKKLATAHLWNDEVTEDTVLDFANLIMSDASMGMALSIDDTCLNGNRSGTGGAGATVSTTNLDNSVTGQQLWTGTADNRYAWDGIRRHFQIRSGNSVGSGSTVNMAMLRNAKKAMGKYGVNPRDLVMAVSPNTYQDLLGIDVNGTWAFFNQSTAVTGELPRIDNIPILVHEQVLTNLDATGVYTGAGAVSTGGATASIVKTIAALFRPSGYLFGDRRLVRFERDRNIFSGVNGMVQTWRGDFTKKRPAGTSPTVTSQVEEYIIGNLAS